MKLGILGGGQLARMMVLASARLECRPVVYTPPGDNCVDGLCPITQKAFEDEQALRDFILSCDRVTYEWENIPVSKLKRALEGVPERLFPRIETLEIMADRNSQKTFFKNHDLPTAPFCSIGKALELEQAVLSMGFPGILKTQREGYDGKGQKRVRNREDIIGAWEELGSVPLIFERFIDFQRELSLVACRSRAGEMRFYPLVENLHVNGILRRTLAPAPVLSQKLIETAQTYAFRIGELLDYVGVMALELFQCGNKLLINEMASRVHNTGHWTLDGAVTSQFENHLRAGLDLPLGDTQIRKPTAMLNLIGEIPALDFVKEQVPGLSIHLYGKKARPNRKLGHLNLTAESVQDLEKKLNQVQPILGL